MTGLALGAALWAIDPELEWHVAVLALVSQGLAWWTSYDSIQRQQGHKNGTFGNMTMVHSGCIVRMS